MSNEPGILPEPIPFGKYYLLERISVGGMAEIYKAKAFGVEGFERLLAVKKILSSIAEDESFIEMFVDEAKIAGQLNHPNIAQIFDLGKVDDSYYIALEYISGEDLKTIFERDRRIGANVDIPQICYVIMKVCEGLHYAHNKKDSQGNPLNIVHRDISPQNILLSYEGEVKIIDFGIAKAQGKTSQTQVGVLKGKFSYMSPEQVRGLQVDHRSDIFSLGIVLYEMLTLERLFLGESDFDTLEKIRKVEMSPPSLYNPNIPDELEEIVLKALAQDPDDRFQSAGAFGEALERFMRNQDYYYKNTDLADCMKEAFNEDLEFEQKKLEYFRDLDLVPPNQEEEKEEEEDEGLMWDEDEMETQIFDRDDRSQPMPPASETVEDPDIVYADDSPPAETPRSNSEQVEVVGPDQEVDVVEPGDNAPPTADYDRDEGSPPAEEAPVVPTGDDSPGEPPPPTTDYDRDDRESPVDDPVAPVGHEGLEEPDEPPNLTELTAEDASEPDDDGAPNAEERRRRPTAQLGDDEQLPEPDAPRPRTPSPSTSSAESDDPLNQAWIAGIAAAVMILGIAGIGVWNGWFADGSADQKAKITFTSTEGTPDNVRVLINDKQIYEGSLPHTYALKPSEGQTRIEVTREGYGVDVGKQTLKPGYTYDFEVDLEKSEAGTGEIFVQSAPPGAEVALDGEALDDPTPVTADQLEAGTHTLTLRKDGYREAEREVSLEDEESTEIEVELSPQSIALTIESDPEEASFEVIDASSDETVETGETPETIEELDTSTTYHIRVERNGYEVWQETFEPGTASEPAVTAELVEREDTSESERVAQRNTDDEPDRAGPPSNPSPRHSKPESETGDSPETGGEQGSSASEASSESTGSPPSGNGSNTAESSGNDPASVDPPRENSSDDEGSPSDEEPPSRADNTSKTESDHDSSGDNEDQGSSSESSEPGTVKIQSIPPAEVYIDGSSVGYTPIVGHELSPGKHEVRLSNEGAGINKTYYVDIKPGESKKVINKN